MKNRYVLTALRLICFLLPLLFAENASAQNRTRVAFIDVLRKMETCKDSVCTFKNLEIWADDFDPEKYVALDTVIEAEVIFENCTFSKNVDDWRSFTIFNYTFLTDFTVNNCPFDFFFRDCTFKELCCINDLNQCQFYGCLFTVLRATDLTDYLSISRCIFLTSKKRYSNDQAIYIFCEKKPLQDLRISHTQITKKINSLGFIIVHTGKIDKIMIDSVRINQEAHPAKNKRAGLAKVGLALLDIKTEMVDIKNCDFDSSVFAIQNAVISGQFNVHENKGIGLLLLENTLIPDKTNFDYNQINNERATIELSLEEGGVKAQYAFISPKDFANKYKYIEMLHVYARLLKIYRETGDNESATGCYVEMKDLQSRYQEYLYQKEPSLKNYFDWKIQVFLKFFCDYGSDPVKSLLYSVYLMGLFSILYFIFPSETDNLQRNRWIPLFRRAMRYFQTNVPIDASGKQDFKGLRELVALKRALVDASGALPGALHVYGMLLYRAHLARYAARRWAYRRVDFSRQPYATLPVWQKRRVALGAALFLTAFLSWGLFQRVLHAAALSMNAFVTLGYGEIQAHGVARYLAVIEGVCGWFLLSIFSVSLINNVMQ